MAELSYRALFVSSPVLPGLMSNRFLRVDWEEGGENVGKAVEWALEMCSGWALGHWQRKSRNLERRLNSRLLTLPWDVKHLVCSAYPAWLQEACVCFDYWLNTNNFDGRILNHEQDYKTYVHNFWMIEILYETVLANF